MKNAIKKARSWMKCKSVRVATAMSGAMVGLMATASAAEGDTTTTVDTVVSTMTTAVQEYAGKASTLIGVMIVAAIPIAGGLWIARRAFAWFKGMAR